MTLRATRDRKIEVRKDMPPPKKKAPKRPLAAVWRKFWGGKRSRGLLNAPVQRVYPGPPFLVFGQVINLCPTCPFYETGMMAVPTSGDRGQH